MRYGVECLILRLCLVFLLRPGTCDDAVWKSRSDLSRCSQLSHIAMLKGFISPNSMLWSLHPSVQGINTDLNTAQLWWLSVKLDSRHITKQNAKDETRQELWFIIINHIYNISVIYLRVQPIHLPSHQPRRSKRQAKLGHIISCRSLNPKTPCKCLILLSIPWYLSYHNLHPFFIAATACVIPPCHILIYIAKPRSFRASLIPLNAQQMVSRLPSGSSPQPKQQQRLPT